jgi:peptidoglycan/xylan/chitin deacetylase (PgdA/CDA1 family)
MAMFAHAAALVAAAGVLVVPTALLAPQSARAATNTIVSLTFDDGSTSQYSTLPMLQSRGMRGTYYVNSGLVGSSSYYMNWSQIHELANAGNEITGHTVNHTDLTAVSLSTAQREVCDDRTNLLNQGFSPVASFAYPYAAVNATAEQVVRDCGYTTGRGVGGIACGGCPHAETIPPGDPFALRTPEPAVSTTTLAQLQSYVTQAETNGGGWVIFNLHGICSNGCAGSYSLNPAVFTAFLDWLQPRTAVGTVVRTVGAVMGASTPPPAGPPATSIGCNGTSCASGWYRTSPVTISLTATDPDGSAIASTRYTEDGTDPATSATASTYTAPFPITRTTTVRYSSTDVDGHVEATKSQLVQVDAAAPSIAITSPPAGASFARGAQITLSANTADSGSGGGLPSGVARVIYLDGTTQLATTTTEPYQVTWTTRKNLKVGSHTLTAIATDVAGNSTTSAPVVITITR